MTQTPPAPTPAFTPADGEKILAENFAPWVLDLALTVLETGPEVTVLRLPWSDRLARDGGSISGQALMAAADTATVLAISAARGAYGPMTTVQQSTSFQRPVTGADVIIRVRVTKLGKRMAFADITMTPEGAAEPSATASTVYALLG
ncbi:PaaI family thioesterase [Streptomyces sp. G-G2]|uniref:PaaI family thioesterase n=1 Tax=Streptomyces sp. G-G2 TaxID=3046201 RepID=UPI0024BA3C2B|nr:PaaI family thioesterase [Streptomyces sp. G-G2]MDJ0382739.1 PaaI family thioesterase [Streptomyces sp. G-G2]